MARRRSRPAGAAAVRRPDPTNESRWAKRLPPLIIAGAGLAAYLNSLNIPFIWEDSIAIVNNRTIRTLWPLPGPFAPPIETPMAGRPIPNLSLAINYAVGGLDATGYHWWNIGVHVGCALLLYFVVRDTFARWRGDRPTSDRAASNIALVAALVWMLHPLQTEAVNYLTQRTESMMGLFFLITLYAAIRARGAARRGLWEAVAVFASALGMASKASMVVAPVVVVLYDRMFEFDSLKEGVRERRRLYAGLATTWLVLAALLWLAPRSTVGTSSAIESWTYLLNQAEVIGRYLRLAVWPRGLVLDYGLPQPLGIRDVLPRGIAIVALTVATAIACVRWPRAGFLGVVFFLTLAPTSSVIPISSEVGAERRMYVPMMAAAVLAVAVGHWLLARVQRRFAGDPRAWARAAVAASAAVVIALGASTVVRNAIFADGVRLWRGAVEERPHGRARLSLGMALEQAGQRDEAIRQLQIATTDYSEARYALGTELYLAGRVDEAIDALAQFVAAQPSSPSRIPARSLLGRAYAAKKNFEAAEAQFRAIAEVAPSDVDARVSLGDLFLAQARYGEAAAEYQVVVPRMTDATIEAKLGMALMGANRPEEAATHFETALGRDPRSVLARRRLAEIAWQRKDAAAAISHTEAALELVPDDGATHNFLGMVLASTGRLSEAVVHFRSAVRFNPSDEQARANLARAESLLSPGR